MSNLQNFKLFHTVVSNAVKHLNVNADVGNKSAGFVSVHKYATFYERKKICAANNISLSEFLSIGINHASKPLSDADKQVIFGYEHCESYKALIGFVYLYNRTARGAYKYVADIAGINKNYLRQVVSEHVICSTRVLEVLSSIYGSTYASLVEMGSLILNATTLYEAEQQMYTRSDLIDETKIQIPFVPIIPGKADNAFDNTNPTMILCVALNKILTTLSDTWNVYSLSKQCNVHSEILNRALAFDVDNPHEINFKTHMAIAAGLEMPLFELYRIGMNEYANNLHPETFTKAMDSMNVSKDTSNADKKSAVEAYKYVVTNTPDIPIKAILSEITGVGFPLLSKILTVNAIPSVNVLERIASSFGMSYDELADMGNMSDDEKSIALKSILQPGKPIHSHLLGRKHVKEVRTEKIAALLLYVKEKYTAKGLSAWIKKAGVSSSCVHNIMNRKTYSSNSSINKLAQSIGIEGTELVELGGDIHSKQPDIVLAAEELLSKKFAELS